MMVDGRRSLGCGGLDGSGIGDGASCDAALTRSLGVGCALTTKGDGSTSGPGCGCGLLNAHARRALTPARVSRRRARASDARLPAPCRNAITAAALS